MAPCKFVLLSVTISYVATVAAVTHGGDILEGVKTQADILVPPYDIGTYFLYKYQMSLGRSGRIGSSDNINIHVFDGEGKELLDYTTSNPNAAVPDFDGATSVVGIGSNSKAITSATLMASVVDTGLANLTSKLSDILPDIFGPGIPANDQAGSATLESLLSHTSGIQQGSLYCKKVDPSVTNLEECVTAMAKTSEPGFRWGEPGVTFIYANAGFQVAALAMERLTGKSFEEIFQTYIAGPTGMSSATYDCPIQDSTPEIPSPAAGLCATADDHAKFFQMLLLNGTTPAGTKVLEASSVDAMFTDRTNGADLTGMMKFLTWDQWAGGPCLTTTDRFRNEATIAQASMPMSGVFTIDPALLDPENKPILGYGLGSILHTGIKSTGILHYDSRGWGWYIARGRYALTMAPSPFEADAGSVSVSVIPMVYMLEKELFPDEDMCPGFTNAEEQYVSKQIIDPLAATKVLELEAQLKNYQAASPSLSFASAEAQNVDSGAFKESLVMLMVQAVSMAILVYTVAY